MRKRTTPHEELDKEREDKRKEFSKQEPEDNPPLELFHYTTPDGLMGVVQTNKLWATNTRYLNDFTEVRYTYNLLREMTGKISRQASPFIQDFLNRFIEELGFYDVIFDAYVFCLSEAGDQLSQWREYASRGIGYSIGFRGAGLKRSFGHRVGMKLLKVIYDKSKQMQIVERIIIDTCSFLENIENKYSKRTNENIMDCCDLLMAALIPYTVQFKHEVFFEEQEWRIVYIPFHDITDKILFRSANKMIVPYIEFGMQEKLPINSVYQGPQAELEITRKSLQSLFSKYQYSNISIRNSRAPIRF